MTTRTRERRRRRKALARWWERDVKRRIKEIERATEEMNALALDAYVFGRTVIEYGGGLPPRRVPPSDWGDGPLAAAVRGWLASPTGTPLPEIVANVTPGKR